MKTVNLNEILEKHNIYGHKESVQNLLNAMREACEQTVELCAEIDKKTIYKKGKWFNEVDSIINTKTQIV